ncbi:hypothetical protein M9H77_11884 [Catharanthus roseus]|uniref:Uncharacterized protein n=1 Tax=Catharanthus roseus TaxID=4058 RepID=A0ACC0BFX3_CATRO|nr:hypothetical protein M9H77_11884 [Catharanthus roseus]
MIGSTERVRNLKRGHRAQVPASHNQYQSKTQSTLYERLIFHEPPHTPLIHKIESSPYRRALHRVKRNTALGLTFQRYYASINWIQIKSKPTKHVVRKRPSYRGLATNSAIFSTR